MVTVTFATTIQALAHPRPFFASCVLWPEELTACRILAVPFWCVTALAAAKPAAFLYVCRLAFKRLFATRPCTLNSHSLLAEKATAFF
jgi:hypothetical protein